MSWGRPPAGVDALGREIAAATGLSHRMINEYQAWGSKLRVGEVQQGMYGDLIDFVNFRIETADTCLSLVDAERVADTLGLCRSLLENYLLLMLMCRGYKYFRLRDCTAMTKGDFKAEVRAEQAKVDDLRDRGKAHACLEVRSYPRANKHIMYVYEGLMGDDDSGIRVPLHYFFFQQFQPEAMRLDQADYFSYLPIDAEVAKAHNDYKAEETHRYRHYLSYDALVQCLQLNGLLDDASEARLEAHYTFLGKFLHPTHNAARDLHEMSNYYEGQPAIGINQPYAGQAVLLAALYVCYLLAGILDEIAGIHESAPAKYLADPGTTSLRALATQVPLRFPYFWFLTNEAPLYDKFKYACSYVPPAELAAYGGYAGVPSKQVPFDQRIYEHLKAALNTWSGVAGHYLPPLGPP